MRTEWICEHCGERFESESESAHCEVTHGIRNVCNAFGKMKVSFAELNTSMRRFNGEVFLTCEEMAAASDRANRRHEFVDE